MKYSPELINAEYRPSWDSSMKHSLQQVGVILLKPLSQKVNSYVSTESAITAK